MLLTWKDLYTFWMQTQHTGSARYLLVVTWPVENNSPTVFSSEQALSTTLQYQTTKRATDGSKVCGGERPGLGVLYGSHGPLESQNHGLLEEVALTLP